MRIIYLTLICLLLIFYFSCERKHESGYSYNFDTIINRDKYTYQELFHDYNKIDSLCVPKESYDIDIHLINDTNFYSHQDCSIYYLESLNKHFVLEAEEGPYPVFYKHMSYRSSFYSDQFKNIVYSCEFPDVTNNYEVGDIVLRNNKPVTKIFKDSIFRLRYNYIKYYGNEYDGWQGLYLKYSNKPFKTRDIPIVTFKIGINETTDTIFSSVNPLVIKKIYPEFKGVVVQEKIDKIIIDYSYNPRELEFYHKIKIIK